MSTDTECASLVYRWDSILRERKRSKKSSRVQEREREGERASEREREISHGTIYPPPVPKTHTYRSKCAEKLFPFSVLDAQLLSTDYSGYVERRYPSEAEKRERECVCMCEQRERERERERAERAEREQRERESERAKETHTHTHTRNYETTKVPLILVSGIRLRTRR
jgi:hypothetical protein